MVNAGDRHATRTSPPTHAGPPSWPTSQPRVGRRLGVVPELRRAQHPARPRRGRPGRAAARRRTTASTSCPARHAAASASHHASGSCSLRGGAVGGCGAAPGRHEGAGVDVAHLDLRGLRRRVDARERAARGSPRAEEQLGDELVEPLVPVAAVAEPRRRRTPRRGDRRPKFRAPDRRARRCGRPSRRAERLLDLRIGCEALRLLGAGSGTCACSRARSPTRRRRPRCGTRARRSDACRPSSRPRAASRGRTRRGRLRTRIGSPGRTCPIRCALRSMWNSLSGHSVCATAWWNDSPDIVSCANSGLRPTISGYSSSSMNASA